MREAVELLLKQALDQETRAVAILADADKKAKEAHQEASKFRDCARAICEHDGGETRTYYEDCHKGEDGHYVHCAICGKYLRTE